MLAGRSARLVAVGAVLALLVGLVVTLTRERTASHSPATAADSSHSGTSETLAPSTAALPERSAHEAPDLGDLRQLALDVLEAFNVPRVAPDALPRSVRDLLLERRGVKGLESLRALDGNDSSALGKFLSTNPTLLDGWEEDLVDLVTQEERWAWHRELARFLSQHPSAQARAQMLRLSDWALQRALQGGAEGIAAEAETDRYGPWDAVRGSVSILDGDEAEAESFLITVGRTLELTPDAAWSEQGGHPDWIAWEGLFVLARIDTPSSAAAIRELLDSPSMKARQAAANAAVAAIAEGGGTRLAESLDTWATEVVYGVIAVPPETRRLAWIVFAGKGDEALPLLWSAQPVNGDRYESLAWAHAVLRAARAADHGTSRAYVRDLFQDPRSPLRDEDFQYAAYSTLAAVGNEDDWSWICERARASADFTSLYVLDGIPAESWRGHEDDLVRLLSDLAAREDVDEAYTSIELGFEALAEVAPDRLSAFEASIDPEVSSDAHLFGQVAERRRGERTLESLTKELDGRELQEVIPLLVAALDSLPRSMRNDVSALLEELGEAAPCEDLERALRDPELDPRASAALLTGLLEAPSRSRCGVAPYADLLPALASRASGVKDSWPWSLLRAMAIVAVLEGREERAVVARALDAWPASSGSPKDKKTGALGIDVLRKFLERADALGVDRIF